MRTRLCGFLFGQRLILSIQGAAAGAAALAWSFENLCKSFNTLQTDHNDKPKAETAESQEARAEGRNDCFEYFTSKHFRAQGVAALQLA